MLSTGQVKELTEWLEAKSKEHERVAHISNEDMFLMQAYEKALEKIGQLVSEPAYLTAIQKHSHIAGLENSEIVFVGDAKLAAEYIEKQPVNYGISFECSEHEVKTKFVEA